jgi:hypothetical protein
MYFRCSIEEHVRFREPRIAGIRRRQVLGEKSGKRKAMSDRQRSPLAMRQPPSREGSASRAAGSPGTPRTNAPITNQPQGVASFRTQFPASDYRRRQPCKLQRGMQRPSVPLTSHLSLLTSHTPSPSSRRFHYDDIIRLHIALVAATQQFDAAVPPKNRGSADLARIPSFETKRRH